MANHTSAKIGDGSTSSTVTSQAVRASSRSRCGLTSVLIAEPSSNATTS